MSRASAEADTSRPRGEIAVLLTAGVLVVAALLLASVAGAPEPAVVEIRVTGEVGELSMASFEGFTSVVEPVSTTMRGPVRDEAERLVDTER